MPRAMTTLVEHEGTAGLRLAELPLPFPVEPVNAWIFVNRPVTVVDPGMFFDESTERLEAALAEAGLTTASVDQIVVTHADPDHFGAAVWLSRKADAPIICGAPEAAKLLSFGAERIDERSTHYMALLASVGPHRTAGHRHRDAQNGRRSSAACWGEYARGPNRVLKSRS